mmetsp:Transcript_20002/g.25985  ORF Transcript_20002/g.25985 Transcript_20002/m.25985 type:complete len:492 (+) Transcript_20002:93-1568(+)
MASDCAFDGSAIPEGFCVREFRSDLDRPRSIFVTESNDILVLERGKSRIIALHDDDGDLYAEGLSVIAQTPDLSHGLTVFENHVYASSPSTVFRWNYTHGQRFESTNAEVVIQNMNSLGCADCGAPDGHSTRTLIFDHLGRLYVSVGSQLNVDPDSYRSRIRRFNISNITDGGIDFSTGEVFADGLRNEVGLAFDKHNVLWGVENGADNLERDDIGGDIHNENPAEELNRFPESVAGQHFGYPYCWSEFLLPDEFSRGKGSRWAWPTFMDTIDDEWCRNNTLRSAMAMQAHSAPLGITFYEHAEVEECTGGFPTSMNDDAIIAFHGSWNRDIPTGYKVVRVPFDADGLPDSDQPINLFCYGGDSARWPSGIRPVDVKFTTCKQLLISSDGTRDSNGDFYGGNLMIMTYHGPDNISSADIQVVCENTQLVAEEGCGDFYVCHTGWAIALIVTGAVTLFALIGTYLFKREKNVVTRGDDNKISEQKGSSVVVS